MPSCKDGGAGRCNWAAAPAQAMDAPVATDHASWKATTSGKSPGNQLQLLQQKDIFI